MDTTQQFPFCCHPSISCHTFPVQKIPLSWVEAEAICRSYANFWEHKALKQSHTTILNDLELRIHQQILDRGGKAFLKISGQSAKDVALFRSNKYMQKAFAQKLSRVSPDDHNKQLIAFLEAVNIAMCITSGAQAIEYITKSHRIVKELHKYIRSKLNDHFQVSQGKSGENNNEEEENQNSNELVIILRDFIPLSVDQEFRCFIKNKKLVAISQYESGAYFEQLQGKAKNIERIIKDFFKNVSPLIYENNFIIDIVIIGSKVNIVEMHRWSEDNSACLFDWEADKNELQSAEGNSLQVLVRFRDSPLDDPLIAIPSRKWKEFIVEYYKTRRSVLGFRIRPVMLRYSAMLGVPLVAMALWFLRSHCKHFSW